MKSCSISDDYYRTPSRCGIISRHISLISPVFCLVSRFVQATFSGDEKEELR